MLVVDADAEGRRCVCAYMRAAGLDVLEAGDTTGALAWMKQLTPDVLVLDPVVPASGALILDCRRDPELRAVPVILLSADPDLSHAASVFGARATVAKPTDLDILLAVVLRAARC